MSTSNGPYHHGALRDALIAAALELLAETGEQALSLRAVARRAGVSAMAPYRHYADRAALLAAVAAEGFAGLRDALRAADAGERHAVFPGEHHAVSPGERSAVSPGERSAVSPGEALIAQAGAYVRYACDHPALFRLMFGPHQPGAHATLKQAGDTAYAVLAERVAVALPGDDLDVRALGCWSLVHGLAMLFLDGQLAGALPGPVDAAARQVAGAMLALRPA